MKRNLIICFIGILCMSMPLYAYGDKDVKHRVIVLTDIENEPDDAMSLVRFLTYSNQWDVEGLIATTSVHQKRELATWRIKEIVNAYGKVQPNLLKHEKGYPTAKYLLSVVKEGRPDYGMHAVERAWTRKVPNSSSLRLNATTTARCGYWYGVAPTAWLRLSGR